MSIGGRLERDEKQIASTTTGHRAMRKRELVTSKEDGKALLVMRRNIGSRFPMLWPIGGIEFYIDVFRRLVTRDRSFRIEVYLDVSSSHLEIPGWGAELTLVFGDHKSGASAFPAVVEGFRSGGVEGLVQLASQKGWVIVPYIPSGGSRP